MNPLTTNGAAVFVTGATGFIGARFVTRAGERPDVHVRCLHRQPPAPSGRNGVDLVGGDIRRPESYRDALRGMDLVVHLAATTGKAQPAEYFSVNVEGTRALLDACRSASVPRLVFVSSIAATYRDQAQYYYAQSKTIAEQAVRESGLNYLIVRPTIVLGPGGPIWNKLSALARLPVVPMFGDGTVRVQPVYVDDVVTFLMSTLDDASLPNSAVDLGGPDIVTFEDLLRRIARAVVGREPPVVHLPARPLLALLTLAERWSGSMLPFTVGQLSAFVNESVATTDSSVRLRVPRMTSLDNMLRLLSS